MTWETYMRFPSAYRRWLIDRIGKEINRSQENNADIPSKAPHHNTSDVRSMLGKAKQNTQAAKFQRF
jgi:hypothetical protein